MNEWMTKIRTFRYLPEVLIFVVTCFLFWNMWSIYSTSIPDVDEADSPPSKTSVAKKPQDDVGKSLDVPFFGVYIPEGSTDIQDSSLDIKIVGIGYSDVEKSSTVFIERANGEQKGYRIGDTIARGAVIKKISKDGLVIWYNGRLEKVSLPEETLQFENQAPPLQQEMM